MTAIVILTIRFKFSISIIEKVKIKMESTTKLYLLVIKLTKLLASELTLWSI